MLLVKETQQEASLLTQAINILLELNQTRLQKLVVEFFFVAF